MHSEKLHEMSFNTLEHSVGKKFDTSNTLRSNIAFSLQEDKKGFWSHISLHLLSLRTSTFLPNMAWTWWNIEPNICVFELPLCYLLWCHLALIRVCFKPYHNVWSMACIFVNLLELLLTYWIHARKTDWHYRYGNIYLQGDGVLWIDTRHKYFGGSPGAWLFAFCTMPTVWTTLLVCLLSPLILRRIYCDQSGSAAELTKWPLSSNSFLCCLLKSAETHQTLVPSNFEGQSHARVRSAMT